MWINGAFDVEPVQGEVVPVGGGLRDQLVIEIEVIVVRHWLVCTSRQEKVCSRFFCREISEIFAGSDGQHTRSNFVKHFTSYPKHVLGFFLSIRVYGCSDVGAKLVVESFSYELLQVASQLFHDLLIQSLHKRSDRS